jgi:hypothetical protein
MSFALKNSVFKHSRSVSKKYNESYGMIIGNCLKGKGTHAMHGYQICQVTEQKEIKHF